MTGGDRITPDRFRAMCGCFTTGVAVATTCDANGERWGLTVNSFSSVSLDPPLVLFSIECAAKSHDAFTGSRLFAINILSENQRPLSERFSLLREADRFHGVALMERSAASPPVLHGCLVTAVCQLETSVPGGDHTILVGRVVEIVEGEGTAPLVFYKGGYSSIPI